jgi:5-methylthioadenosine/S-adenosylhomocysteine deaminase
MDMALTIKGTIVPLMKSLPEQTFKGRVYLTDDGRIEATKKLTEAALAGFAGVTEVDVGDNFAFPGLIDLHSHLGYNALPLWTEPNEPKPFLHHDIWPGRSTYKPKVSWPAWVLAKAAPEALLAYVQIQALAGGTTAIQGWPSANRSPAKLSASSTISRLPIVYGRDSLPSIVALSKRMLSKDGRTGPN